MSFASLPPGERELFLSLSPPRRIPREVSRKLMPLRGNLVGLLVGGIFLLFGLLFCAVFVPRHLPQEWRLKQGPAAVVRGKIFSAEKTRAKANEVSVWKYGFTFLPPGGAEHKGVAYATGKRYGKNQAAEIRYLIADPAVAVPVGARMDEIPAWGAFVLLFPLVGSVVLIGGIYGWVSRRRLLVHGLVGRALVTAVEKSSYQSNGQYLYKIRLTRQDDGVPISKRAYESAEIDVAMAKLKSGEPLTILYDRMKTKRFLIVDVGDAAVAEISRERFFQQHPLSAVPPANPAAVQMTETFLGMPIPRRVPRAISKKAFRSSGLLPLQIFGAVFFVMGLGFSWIFLPLHLPKQWRLDAGSSATVPGKIVSVEDAKMEINDVKVMRHRYSFQPENGVKTEGVAYRSGQDWMIGTAVRVRYLISDPALSVPDGARMGAGTAGAFFVLIFPLVGGALLFGPMVFKHRRKQLLRNGVISAATITSVEKTAMQVNDRYQYKIHLLRTDDAAPMEKRTHLPVELDFAMRKWRSAEPVKILYLPGKAKGFLLPESWDY